MTKIITGAFSYPSGQPVANGVLKLQLSQDANISGDTQVAPLTYYITLDAEGNIPSGTEIIANDEISVAGTYYIATVKAPGFGYVYGPENWSLLGTSPINVNNIPPNNTPQAVDYPDNVIGPVTVVGTPSAGQTIVATSSSEAEWSTSGGILLQTNGTDNTSQSQLNLVEGTNVTISSDSSGDVTVSATGGGAETFAEIESGTNTTATMTVGTGATLTASGSGVVNATEINGIPITGTLTHAGQIPISQPGNTDAVWADPLVQGTYAPASNANTAYSGSPINPVLIGGSDGTYLRNILTDSSGRIYINVNGTVGVTGTFYQTTQPVSIASLPALTTGSANIGGVEIIDASGTNKLSVNSSGYITISNTSFAATQSGTWTVATNADGSVTGGTAASKSLLTAGQYNSSAPALTSGQQAALQLDANGNLNVNIKAGSSAGTQYTTGTTQSTPVGTVAMAQNPSNVINPLTVDASGYLQVNIKAGAGSGGTAIADESTFTQGTTSFTPIGGYYSTSVTNLTTGQGGAVQLTADRNMFVNLNKVGGTALTLGQTTMSASLPVCLASNQSSIPVTGTGTFAVQSAQTGTWTVGISASQTIAVTNTGTFAVQAAQSGTWNVTVNTALPAGSNTIGAVTQASGPWTVNQTQLNSVALGSPSNYGTSPGAVAVQGVNAYITNTPAVSQSGTWTVGISASQTIAVTQATAASLNATVVGTGTFAVQSAQSGTWTVQPGNTPNTTAWLVQTVPGTSGGYSTNVQQAITTSASVKGSAGQFQGIDIFNSNAGTVYVFIYNTTSAPTIGSTTNLVWQKGIPGATSGVTGIGANYEIQNGIACGTGIYIAVSTSATGSAAPGTGLVITTFYK